MRVIAACVVLVTGCSAIAVRGPQTTPRGEVVCASYVPPVIDAAIAVAGAALIAWGVTAEKDPEGHRVTGRNFAAVPGVLVLLPFAFSSAYGFTKAGCPRK